jgi:hypothetical protein
MLNNFIQNETLISTTHGNSKIQLILNDEALVQGI